MAQEGAGPVGSTQSSTVFVPSQPLPSMAVVALSSTKSFTPSNWRAYPAPIGSLGVAVADGAGVSVAVGTSGVLVGVSVGGSGVLVGVCVGGSDV